MGRFSLAWRVLTDGSFSKKVTSLLDAPVLPTVAAPPKPVVPPTPVAPSKPLRSDAVTLLAALQREGRFIDFLKEPLEQYPDDQVAAAARNLHRECSAMLERQFAIRPVLNQAEGSNVTIGADVRNGKIKLTGKIGDGTQASGTLVHHGWLVTKSDVPVWTGAAEAASVVAPAEVEVR